MTEQEAVKIASRSGSVDIGTVKALMEMYPKEIEEYTKEDFQTTKPYEYVQLYGFDDFEQGVILSKLDEQARKVRFPNFRTMYKRFRKNQPDTDSTGTDDFSDNYTDFSSQPLSLRCGRWICDDSGVRIETQSGTAYACPHPIMPVARMQNIDTGIEKVKVAFRRGRGWRTAVFERKTLSSVTKIIDLADCGIAVTSENARDLVRYFYDLEQLNPDTIPETLCVSHLGWLEHSDELEFVPYTEGIIFDGEAEYKKRFESVSMKGDFQVWLDCMNQNIRQNSQPMARIVFAASLSSVLIKLLDCNCYWLHLWGGTSTAKTVLTMCAGSIWGNPERGQFLSTFNSTVVGNEKSAAFSGSMPYMMDELQLVDTKKDMDAIIYMLTEGCGRTRGNKYGGIDPTSEWRNCAISTGERPLNSLSSGGGAMARVIEVECKQPFFGDDENARKVVATINNNYGFFGHAFVSFVQKKTREELDEIFNKYCRQLTDCGIMVKQAQAAALILTADELACEMCFDEETMLTAEDILPFLKTKDEVDVNKRAYEFLCEQVVSNQYRFMPSSDRPTELWGIFGGDNSVYIIKSVFARMCSDGDFNSQSLLSWLDDRGLIERTQDRKNRTVTKRIGGVVSRCIHLALCDNDGGNDDYLVI